MASGLKPVPAGPSQISATWLYFLSHRKQIGLFVGVFVSVFRGSLLFAEQTVLIDTLSRISELLILGSAVTFGAGAAKSDSFYAETLARTDVGLPERRGGDRQRKAIVELKAVAAAPVLDVVREAVAEIKADTGVRPPGPMSGEHTFAVLAGVNGHKWRGTTLNVKGQKY